MNTITPIISATVSERTITTSGLVPTTPAPTNPAPAASIPVTNATTEDSVVDVETRTSIPRRFKNRIVAFTVARQRARVHGVELRSRAFGLSNLHAEFGTRSGDRVGDQVGSFIQGGSFFRA